MSKDGVVIFVCEHPDGVSFCQVVDDPPKSRPNCTTCGQPAKHMGPADAQRILARETSAKMGP